MPTVPVAKRRPGQRVGALRLPSAGAQIPLGRRKLADRVEQKAERRVCHLLGQHVRRVGDDDPVAGAVIEVDPVIADAEIGDDLELRQALEQVARDVEMAAAGDPANGVAGLRQHRVEVLGVRGPGGS